MKLGSRLQTKLWNAFRFVSQHLSEKPERPESTPDMVNEWLIARSQQVRTTYIHNFDDAEYARSLEIVDHFFGMIFCDNYLELIKDRIFNPDKYDATQHAWTKYALYTVGLDLLKLYAPFMPTLPKHFTRRSIAHTKSFHQRVLLHLKTQLKMTIHY